MGEPRHSGKGIITTLAKSVMDMQENRWKPQRGLGPIQESVAIRPAGKSQSKHLILRFELRPQGLCAEFSCGRRGSEQVAESLRLDGPRWQPC